jgi:hypothetical protein
VRARGARMRVRVRKRKRGLGTTSWCQVVLEQYAAHFDKRQRMTPGSASIYGWQAKGGADEWKESSGRDEGKERRTCAAAREAKANMTR